MANTVDPDEMAHYEPSHLDLQCLQNQLLLCLALYRLKNFKVTSPTCWEKNCVWGSRSGRTHNSLLSFRVDSRRNKVRI